MSEKPKKSSKSIAEYEHEISILKAEIDDLKLKLEHMNEILVNMQRARFGQSSEKQKYVSPDQLSVFNEAEAGQDPRKPGKTRRLPNPMKKRLSFRNTSAIQRDRLQTEWRSFLRRTSFLSCPRMKETVRAAAILCVKWARNSCARSSLSSENR